MNTDDRKSDLEKAIAATDITEPTVPVREVVEQVVARPDLLLLHISASEKHAPVAEEKKAPSKTVARTPRTLASRRGAELVRYLRIHTKLPLRPGRRASHRRHRPRRRALGQP